MPFQRANPRLHPQIAAQPGTFCGVLNRTHTFGSFVLFKNIKAQSPRPWQSPGRTIVPFEFAGPKSCPLRRPATGLQTVYEGIIGGLQFSLRSLLQIFWRRPRSTNGSAVPARGGRVAHDRPSGQETRAVSPGTCPPPAKQPQSRGVDRASPLSVTKTGKSWAPAQLSSHTPPANQRAGANGAAFLYGRQRAWHTAKVASITPRVIGGVAFVGFDASPGRFLFMVVATRKAFHPGIIAFSEKGGTTPLPLDFPLDWRRGKVGLWWWPTSAGQRQALVVVRRAILVSRIALDPR